MSLIQIFLIGSFIASLVGYFVFWRSAALDRLIALGFFALACLAVMFPEFTSVLAQYLGVGRGTDLLLYVFFAASLFFGILMYSKTMRLEARITELVRHIAVMEALSPIHDQTEESGGGGAR